MAYKKMSSLIKYIQSKKTFLFSLSFIMYTYRLLQINKLKHLKQIWLKILKVLYRHYRIKDNIVFESYTILH